MDERTEALFMDLEEYLPANLVKALNALSNAIEEISYYDATDYDEFVESEEYEQFLIDTANAMDS